MPNVILNLMCTGKLLIPYISAWATPVTGLTRNCDAAFESIASGTFICTSGQLCHPHTAAFEHIGTQHRISSIFFVHKTIEAGCLDKRSFGNISSPSLAPPHTAARCPALWPSLAMAQLPRAHPSCSHQMCLDHSPLPHPLPAMPQTTKDQVRLILAPCA